MSSHVLITAIPIQEVSKPPGILSVLAGCCESAGATYDIFDLNLHMHQTVPEEMCQQLGNDFLHNKLLPLYIITAAPVPDCKIKFSPNVQLSANVIV